MNPKKVKNLLPIVAVENKLDIVLLQKLNSFYWSKVREVLTTTDEMNVEILNLGKFTRKHWNLDKRILRMTNLLEAVKKSGRIKMAENMENDLELLKKMKLSYESELQRKDQKIIIKNEYKNHLEEPISDPGRDAECGL